MELFGTLLITGLGGQPCIGHLGESGTNGAGPLYPMDLFCVEVIFCGVYPPRNEASEFTPENGWLEYDCFLFGFGLFSGAMSC